MAIQTDIGVDPLNTKQQPLGGATPTLHADAENSAATRALSLFQAGFGEEALLVIRQMLHALPSNESLLVSLIEVCYDRKDIQLAQAVATAATKLISQPSPPLKSLVERTTQHYHGLRPDRAFTSRMQSYLSAGAYLELKHALADVMKTVPCWPAGWAFRGIATYMTLGTVPAHDSEVPRSHCARIEFASRASELAQVRDKQVASALEDLRRAVELDPGNAGVARYFAMAKFASGQALSEAEQQSLLPPGASGTQSRRVEFARVGSAKEMALQAACRYQALRASELVQVPQPTRHGQSFASLDGVGEAVLAEAYLAEWADVVVRSRSNLVATKEHGVACDILSHPLSCLANTDFDKWIAARSTEAVLLERTPDPVEIDGLAVSLLGPSAAEYGHWLIEFAPRVEAFETHQGLREATFLVEADMPPTQIQSLTMLLGFQPKLLEVHKGSEVKVNQLLTAAGGAFYPRSCLQGAPMLPTVAATNPKDMQFLRARVHQRLRASGAFPSPDAPQRIYVQRLSPLRKLLNQDAIQALLVERYGFSLIDPSAMDFAEQMRVFANADLVVGANGSAMHNCFACRAGTKVVTLVSEEIGHLPSWIYALTSMGIDHLCAVGTGQDTHPIRQHWDYEVDLKVLEQCLADLTTQ